MCVGGSDLLPQLLSTSLDSLRSVGSLGGLGQVAPTSCQVLGAWGCAPGAMRLGLVGPVDRPV